MCLAKGYYILSKNILWLLLSINSPLANTEHCTALVDLLDAKYSVKSHASFFQRFPVCVYDLHLHNDGLHKEEAYRMAQIGSWM